MKTIKKIRLSTYMYAALTIALFVFMFSLIVAYVLPRSNHTVKKFVDAAPYPIAVINYQNAITYRTLAENMASIKRFYEAQDFSKIGLRVDFSTPEGQMRFKVREKEVLNKMIEDKAIMLLAEERSITVTPEAARAGVQRKLDEYGTSDDVKNNLERLYGWTMEQFESKVVLPSLYEEKVRASFSKEVDTSSKASESIHKAQAALNAGKDFSQVAKQFSEGQTADAGGELGWFSQNDLAPELRQTVVAQKVGVTGNIVESSLGFHILYVEEIKKENDKQLYRLKQIFARKITFADWLTEKMRSLSVFILSPEYRWNTDEARVEFKSQEMQNFEKNLVEKTNGDAMFFF